MPFPRQVALALALGLGLLGCAAPSPHLPVAVEAEDRVPLVLSAKGDGPGDVFDADRLVSDEAFFDVEAVSVAQLQAFLEKTPYGRRSFLADYRLAGGEQVSAAIVRVARARALNPLVLLVTLQKEMALVSRATLPSRERIDWALGCGCADGEACRSAYRGLDKQLACAADVLADGKEALLADGVFMDGWAPGVPHATLDPARVRPANRATAVLYAYTPWILEGDGGGWLFWNVWRKYAAALGYERGLRLPFNEGWIGARCTDDADCFYAGARCAAGVDGGVCTKACERVCPDRHGAAWARTYCAGGPEGGLCRARCSEALAAAAGEGGCPTLGP